MNRLLVLALGAPMLLIGAAYPDKIKSPGAHPAPPPPLQQEAATTYRPCRPGPGDDRCIQLYERGVRAAYARWQRDRGPATATRVAMGGPIEPSAAAASAWPSCRQPAGPLRASRPRSAAAPSGAAACAAARSGSRARGARHVRGATPLERAG